MTDGVTPDKERQSPPRGNPMNAAGLIKIAIIVFVVLMGAAGVLFRPVVERHEAEFLVPVDIVGLPAGTTIVGPAVSPVAFTLRGTTAELAGLDSAGLAYVCDLSRDLAGVGVGVNRVNVAADRLPLPEGLSIVKATPSVLSIRIENEIKKRLPVVVKIKGNPAQGFSVEKVHAEPGSILVRGPEHLLGPMEEVATRPVEIGGASESFKKKAVLSLAEDLTVVSPSKIVVAEIFVGEKIVSSLIAGVPVEGRGSGLTFTITPPRVDIEVSGSARGIEKLKAEGGLVVFVDLTDLSPGVYVRQAKISLPVDTALVGVRPEIITVKIGNG